MAELVDALGSGPSGGNTVEVRVLFWAPRNILNSHRIPVFFGVVAGFSPITRSTSFNLS